MENRFCGVLLAASLVAVTICAAAPAASAAPFGPASAPAGGAPLTAAGLSAAGLPAAPSAWPSTHLEIGLTDSPGGAAALHSSGAYKFRYQYLSGGVNTGTGWATWNANAKFADYYVDESVAAGITPVFIYYQLLQSSPGGGAEDTADLNNLKSTTTMHSYWADVRLLMQHLGAYSQTIVVDLEPDLWGYIQQASTSDNGASVPASVASSGDSDMSGLPNNAAGFAQGFVRLRNKYAPNVLLGYELSMWGTLTDPIAQHIPLAQIDALAGRSTAFEQSLGATFDLVFTDPADRDAGFDQYINGDGGASWWSSTDYDRFNQYVSTFVSGVGLRMVLWQIPLGNTKMRAMNNTWGHYQDNHVQWWLDDTTGHLAATVNSGVIAMLFGGGADGTTSATDARGDGVTNPTAINGNVIASYSADDDGGYFRHQANAYYAGGAMSLPTAPPVAGSTYYIVTPARILDSRDGTGGLGIFHSHVAQGFRVWGTGAVPSGAVAVTGNLTVTQQSSLGFLYIGPAPANDPTSSNLNFPMGDDRASAVTVALSPDGKLYVTYAAPVRATPTAHVILDITGYFMTGSAGATYTAVTPTRILDSRDGTGGLGVFHSHVAQGFTVRGAGAVPNNAVAVTGNLTVTQQSTLGFFYIGPNPADDPTSSTLNFPAGDDRANAVTVALSSDGKLYVTFAAPVRLTPTAHVIFDVTGYFTTDGNGAQYWPLAPARILDSRYGTGGVGAFHSHVAQGFVVCGKAGVPTGATAVTGNLTVTQQSAIGFLYVGPAPANDPTSSNLNFPKGDDRANAVTVAVSLDGKLYVTYAAPSAGPTAQAIFDVTGYFTK